jgi:phage tail-like protein
MPDRELLTAFRFLVSLRSSPPSPLGGRRLAQDSAQAVAPDASGLICDGGFQEASGLEVEMDVQDTLEGGRNNAVIRRLGRGKFPPLVLKRGIFYAAGGDGRAEDRFWQWMMDALDGVRPFQRVDGTVRVMSADGTVRATWTFERGLPAKLRGPELNAKSGEVAIEELSIAHEGLRLARSGGAR